MRNKITAFAIAAGLTCAAAGAHAATVMVTVDAGGKPLVGAVVALESVNGKPISSRSDHGLAAVMDQRDKQFVPHILAVEVGAAVTFPNSDNIRHDVYSFSPPKVFELPLYVGTPAKPVIFDKPGVVVLGCNIHDWMLGFIDVVPTPWFAQTNQSGATFIEGVPPGRYTLTLWAPRIEAPKHTLREAVEVGGGRLVRHFTVTLGPRLAHVHRMPHSDNSVVEKLKRKFGRFRQHQF